MNQTIIRIGCGRGGNKASQSNLKPQVAEYFVMLKGDLGLWSASYGPYQKGKAHKVSNDLNKLGFITSPQRRDGALYHDALGVAKLESAKQ